jgi:hypothetical protein
MKVTVRLGKVICMSAHPTMHHPAPDLAAHEGNLYGRSRHRSACRMSFGRFMQSTMQQR